MVSGQKILIFGSSNMNLVVNMLRLPEKNETTVDDAGVGYVPGGKGTDVAIALTRLGADCVFCTKVGADLHGKKLYDFYKECNIDTSTVTVDHNYPTGLAVLLKEANGDIRTILYPGANAHLSFDNIAAAFACEPQAVYIGFDISFDTALTIAKIASSKNIPIFIDASPASKDQPLENLPYVEIFSPNETETQIYTGQLPRGSDSALHAALALYRRVNCHYIVIKQGDRGAFVYDGKHFKIIPSFRPEAVVDTTAAGDAFTAAMTYEYLRTGDIFTAVEYGNAAGALTLSREGAFSSLPTDADIRAFITKRKRG